MTDLTTPEIAKRLRQEDLGTVEYQELLRAIATRRKLLRARLETIESRNGSVRCTAIASGDPAQLCALNREAETLDEESGILCDLESRAYQMISRAQDRETMEAGRRARKQLSALIDHAATALAAYDDARRQLEGAVDAIGGICNQLRAIPEEQSQFKVSDADFARIVNVLFAGWPEDRLAGPRLALRRRICAADQPQYAEPGPDYREQLHSAMFRRR